MHRDIVESLKLVLSLKNDFFTVLVRSLMT